MPKSSSFEENLERERALAPAMADLSRRLRTVRSTGTLAADTAGLGSAGRPDAAYQLLQRGLRPQESPPEVSTESKSTKPRKRMWMLPSWMPTARVVLVMMPTSQVMPARACTAPQQSTHTQRNSPTAQPHHKILIFVRVF